MSSDATSRPGFLRFFFSPSGRLSRRKYMRGLIAWAIPTVLAVVQVSAAESQGNRTWLMFAVLCLIVVAFGGVISGFILAIKRFHDIDYPAVSALVLLVPFIGFAVFLYLLFARSGPPNIYGPYPDQ
jgi:uncharacterized membrane protein YhaH (DUF805 family)